MVRKSKAAKATHRNTSGQHRLFRSGAEIADERPFKATQNPVTNRFADRQGADKMILRSALRSENARCRSDAVERIGELGLVEFEPMVLSAMSDGTVEVRIAAAVALIRLGDENLFLATQSALGNDDPSVVVGAALVLGNLGAPRSLAGLIDAFRARPDPNAGNALAWSLGRFGFPALGPLEEAVRAFYCVEGACNGLANVGLLAALKPLAWLLSVSRPAADHAAAAAAVAQLFKRTDRQVLKENEGTIHAVRKTLQARADHRVAKVRLCVAAALEAMREYENV